MAFFLSTKRQITLAGTIETLAKKKLGTSAKGGWVITEEELKQALGAKPSDNIEIHHSNGEIFKLRKVIGYSYPEWTPIAFQMEDGEGNLVLNIMYMNGGTQRSSWNFVNSGIYGANLWPDACKFIFSQACEDK